MKNLKFSIDDIELYRDDESVDFAIAKIMFLAVGNNSHHDPISEEVLRRDAYTALGKFVIGKFDKWIGDTTSHVQDQVILGYIPPNSEIEFEEKDDKLFAVATAVISKLYASDVYKMFQKDNLRSVSCEFSASMQYDDDEIAEDKDNPILGFMVHGITVLGRKYAPSCKGADIKIMQFSEEKAVEYYNTHNSVNSLKQFAEERRKKFLAEKTYKVNKTEIKDTAWGDIDKTSLRNAVMNAKNKDKLVHDVYALVEDGFDESPSEKLKYPLMELVGDTFYYNRGALSSALGYAKKENETEVIAKVEKLYKKFKLEEGEDKKMAEIKFAMVNIGDIWGKLWESLHNKYPDGDYGSVYCIDGIYEEDNQKFAIIRHRDEDTQYRLDFSFTEEGMTISDEIVKVELEIKETDEVRKFQEPENTEKYKKFAIEGREAWGDVIKQVEEHEGGHVYVDSVEKDKIIYTDKDGVRYDVKSDVKVGKDDKTVEAKIDWTTKKKSEDQDNIHKFEETPGTKEFSLDANADISAYLEMLENETEEYRELAKKVLADMESDKGLVMQEYVEMAKERDELKKFKDTKDTEAKEFEVNKTLMEAKEDLTEEEFACLKEEGMACKTQEMSAFVNKVKAFAYNNAKKNPHKEIPNEQNKAFVKMAFDWDTKLNKSAATKSAEEIYNKYL